MPLFPQVDAISAHIVDPLAKEVKKAIDALTKLLDVEVGIIRGAFLKRVNEGKVLKIQAAHGKMEKANVQYLVKVRVTGGQADEELAKTCTDRGRQVRATSTKWGLYATLARLDKDPGEKVALTTLANLRSKHLEAIKDGKKVDVDWKEYLPDSLFDDVAAALEEDPPAAAGKRSAASKAPGAAKKQRT